MNYSYVQKDEITVSGLSVELSRSQKRNYIIIRNQWQKLNSLLKIQKLQQDKNWLKYGITYKLNDGYSYIAAIPYIGETIGFDKINIPKGKFMCFNHKGSMHEIKNTVYKIYKQIIPENKIQLNDNRIIMHYELYDHRFNWNNKNSVIDILLPVL